MFPINRGKCTNVGNNEAEKDTGNVGIGKANGPPVFSPTCVAISAIFFRLVCWKISSVLGSLRTSQLLVVVSTLATGELSGAAFTTCVDWLASVCTPAKGEGNGAV